MKIANIACIGGEITPSLWGRVDLDKVKVGLAKCRNFAPFAHGGARFRMGTQFITEAKGECVLKAMDYSSEPTIFVEMGNKYMRFIKDGAYIEKDGSPYEIVSPYEKDELRHVRCAQSIDMNFMVDGYHAPRILSRYSDTNWVIDNYDFMYGPFLPMNGDETHTMKVVSYGGSSGLYGQTVTITSNKDVFTSDDVGRWVKIEYADEGGVINDGSKDPASAGVVAGPWVVDGKWEMRYRFANSNNYAVDVQYSVDGGFTWNTYDSCPDITKEATVTITGELRAEDYNNVMPRIRLYATGDAYTFYWTIKKVREYRWGYVKITNYVNAKNVRGTVYRRCSQLNVPVSTWALGAWGESVGYPSTVAFHPGDRLMFGGSWSMPSDLWASCVGDYFNYEVSMEAFDDEAVNIPIRSRHLDVIRGIIPLRDMVVMTSGGEWVVRGAGQNTPITPDSAYVSAQGFRGSSMVEPVIAGNSVLFVQRYGSRVRDLSYTYEEDGYDSIDRSIYATHLFEGHSIVDWCYQQEPYSIIWAIRDDGKILGFTWMKEHDVWAWHLHELGGGGIAESIASGRGERSDEVYIVVKRGNNRYIERLTLPDENIFLDSSIVFEDIKDDITGLDHLEGQVVTAVADGKYIYDNLVVTGGQVSIPRPADRVVVGVPYSGYVQTLPLTYEIDDDPSVGSRRKLTQLIVEVLDSRFGKYGTHEDYLYDFNYDKNELYTGVLKQNLDSLYDYMGQVIIRQDKPFPFTILTWTVGVAHGDQTVKSRSK